METDLPTKDEVSSGLLKPESVDEPADGPIDIVSTPSHPPDTPQPARQKTPSTRERKPKKPAELPDSRTGTPITGKRKRVVKKAGGDGAPSTLNKKMSLADTAVAERIASVVAREERAERLTECVWRYFAKEETNRLRYHTKKVAAKQAADKPLPKPQAKEFADWSIPREDFAKFVTTLANQPDDPSDERKDERRSRHLPLWARMVDHTVAAGARTENSKDGTHKQQQQILHHIRKMRKAQELPWVFAMLTGPTILKPYRMEALKVTLGRHTHECMGSDLHIGNNDLILPCHARIEYLPSEDCYCLFNFSSQPIFVKGTDKDSFKGHYTSNAPIHLPNPSVINICGVLVYFQVFRIIHSRDIQDHVSKTALVPDEPLQIPTLSIVPKKKKKTWKKKKKDTAAQAPANASAAGSSSTPAPNASAPAAGAATVAALLDDYEEDENVEEDRKDGSRKRERIPAAKVDQLEILYTQHQYVDNAQTEEISERLRLPPEKVRKWFVNRRQKQLADERERGVTSTLQRPKKGRTPATPAQKAKPSVPTTPT